MTYMEFIRSNFKILAEPRTPFSLTLMANSVARSTERVSVVKMWKSSTKWWNSLGIFPSRNDPLISPGRRMTHTDQLTDLKFFLKKY